MIVSLDVVQLQMYKNNKQIQTIKNKLEIFHKKVSSVGQNEPLAMMKECRKICSQLIYWLKYVRFSNTGITIQACLAKCISVLSLVLGSLEVEKYGQIVPELATAINYYIRYVDCNSKATSTKQQLQQRIQLMQRCTYFKDIRTNSISLVELTYLKTQRIHTFLTKLQSNEIVLPNNQCICCSQIFMNGFPASNLNPIFHPLIALEPTKIDTVTVSKSISSICNGGGAVLLGGAITSNGCVHVEGIKYQTTQQIQSKRKEIEEAIKTINPPCFIRLDLVPVKSHFSELMESNPQDHNRVCFRVLARPHTPNRLCFVCISNKGYQNIYELYHPDYPKAVPPSQHYTLMHNQYRRRLRYKLFPNSHQNIGCQKPFHYASQILPPPLYQSVEKYFTQKKQKHSIHEDEPKFPHQYASLLIVGSSKDDRYIQNFQVLLTQNKKIFSLYKPFKDSFKGGGRSIWLLSHKFTFVELLNLQKDFKENCQEANIKVMAVLQKLEVSLEKYTQYYQGILDKRFYERYPKKIHKAIASSTKKIFYQFENRNQALYAYLILEQYQFKPYFVRQIPKGLQFIK